ncbi:MAG: hypothetical protein O2942_09055 [Proteobacteria bacterium]|nr:hypothetical protein [Pseudomonadota bacterium]
MLDFNSSKKFADRVNSFIDLALRCENKKQKPRDYLGGSRLGVECKRALQFEYMNTPKDDGRDFNGQTLRIFAAGHLFEDLVIKWLRAAGFELYTTKKDGNQFGFSVAKGRIRGHVDGIINNAPEELDMGFPALWECKTMNHKNWKDTVKRGVTLSKPVYAGQIATYQAYMESSIPGISKNSALFTAINKDTAEIYHELVPFDCELAQKLTDKAVTILQACDAGELLPRIANSKSFFECKWCSWQDRCWEANA